MSFTVPTFNLTAEVHDGDGTFPPATPVRVTVSCNMSPGSRIAWEVTTFNPHVTYLLMPKLTDVRDAIQVVDPDVIECPAGSGLWWSVMTVQDVAKGFPNEYRRVVCYNVICPIPRP